MKKISLQKVNYLRKQTQFNQSKKRILEIKAIQNFKLNYKRKIFLSLKKLIIYKRLIDLIQS